MVPEDYNLRIRQARDLLGLTQAAFARRVGVSFVTVNRWENRQSKPSRMAWRVIEGLAKEIAGPDDLGPGTGPHAVSESPIRGYAAPATDFAGDPATVQLVVEAERLSFGHLANPAFGIETSMLDTLPHPRLPVYEHMLPQPRLRFLLADDS